MQLTEQQKQSVLDILSLADGEDVNEIINRSFHKDDLTHSLILECRHDDLEYYLSERYELETLLVQIDLNTK